MIDDQQSQTSEESLQFERTQDKGKDDPKENRGKQAKALKNIK